MRQIGLALFAVLICLTACSKKDDEGGSRIGDFIAAQPPIPLDDNLAMELAVGFGYPVQPITFALLPAILGGLSAQQEGCPIMTDNSDEATGLIDVVLEGGCTIPGNPSDPTDNDVTYTGTLTQIGDANEVVMTYLDWTQISQEDCMGTFGNTSLTWSGRTVLGTSVAEAVSYDILMQLTVDGVDSSCNPSMIQLAWDVNIATTSSGADTDSDGEADEFISYDGGGDMGYALTGAADIDPGLPTSGSFSMTATALRHSTIDTLPASTEQCTEPLDGQFVITSGGDTGALQPDGDTGCTIDSCAPWSLNGTDQPSEICDIPGCHVVPRPTRSAGTLAMLLGLALTGAVMRRRTARSV